MPRVLTTATGASCPHGGAARFVAGQRAVRADGAAALTLSCTTTIAGCPFMIGTTPSPCVSVRWLLPARRATAGRSPLLLESSVGLCLNVASAPQGPLQITSVQSRVRAT